MSSDKGHQLVLDLPHRPALAAEDFFVGPSNAAAVTWIDRWPDWPAPALILTGAEGSGKTHLAHVWRLKSAAALVAAQALTEGHAAAALDGRGLVVDGLEAGVRDERALFHILNTARGDQLPVLMTSRLAPGELAVLLPDLRSRLRALPVASIGPPDETLLKAVLVKLLADRQLVVEPHVVSYLVLNMERSMAAAARLVAVLDELSLALHRKVTRPLAGLALERLASS